VALRNVDHALCELGERLSAWSLGQGHPVSIPEGYEWLCGNLAIAKVASQKALLGCRWAKIIPCRCCMTDFGLHGIRRQELLDVLFRPV